MKRLLYLTALICISCTPKVDVADFGASPEADASTNTKAINAALKGGNRKVVISKPGTYLLDSCLLVEDNTTFLCRQGVILKKDKPYSFVITNAGARTRTTNRNIRIIGAEIDANDLYDNPLTVKDPQYGCRGQIDFFHVRNALVKDVTIYGIVTSAATGIQMCSWENVRVQNTRIHTNGDAFHINRGHRLVVKNCEFCSGDDNIPLNAKDWDNSAPEVGDITDALFKNVTCLPHENPHGNVARHLVGSWTDWRKGMEIRPGDCVVNAGHTYLALYGPRAFSGEDNFYPGHFPDDGTKLVSLTEPDFDAATGIMADEGGFLWRYEQDDECYHANIENIRYRNVNFTDDRTVILAYYDTTGIYDRSFHPDTPKDNYPHITGISFDKVRTNSPLLVSVHSAERLTFDYDIRNASLPEKGYLVKVIGTVEGGSVRLGKMPAGSDNPVEVPSNVTVIRE